MNTKEILIQSMASHQQAIDKAKLDLEALDKPKFVHGDYGVNDRGAFRLFCNIKGTVMALCENGIVRHDDPNSNGPKSIDDTYTKLGHIFADMERNSKDMERNSKDLDKFDFIGDESGELKSYIKAGRGRIYIDMSGYRQSFNADEVIEIAKKLIQEAYTLKRKQAK